MGLAGKTSFFHQWKSLLPVEKVLFSRIKYVEEQQEFLLELWEELLIPST